MFFILFSFFLLIFNFCHHLFDKVYYYVNKIFFLYYFVFNKFKYFIYKKKFFLNRISKIEHENIFLKEKIFVLKKKLYFLNILEKENNIFRRILGFPLLNKIKNNFNFVRIFFYNINVMDELIINHMYNKNIRYGSLLFNDLSMLGKVIYFGNNFSKIELICNKNSELPIVILRNNINAIIKGYGCNNYMKINDFPINTDVRIGDIIVLPDIDDYYFSGYPIGVVKNILLDSIYGNLIIEVKYFLDLENLNFAFLYN